MTKFPNEDIIRLIPIPLICIMGMVTNGLNTAVFLNSKMKNTTFKFQVVKFQIPKNVKIPSKNHAHAEAEQQQKGKK